MSVISSHPSSRGRKLRNFLLDAKLQLPIAGYALAIALLVGLVAGAFMLLTTRRLVNQSGALVEARTQAAQSGKEVAMAILRSRVTEAGDDQVYWSQAEAQRKKIDEHFALERAKVVREQAQVISSHRTAVAMLGVGFVLSLLLAGAGGLVLTHRIAPE